MAEKLAAELVENLDRKLLDESLAMGLAPSVFSKEIEEYRAKFDAEVAPEIAAQELFDIAIAKFLR